MAPLRFEELAAIRQMMLEYSHMEAKGRNLDVVPTAWIGECLRGMRNPGKGPRP